MNNQMVTYNYDFIFLQVFFSLADVKMSFFYGNNSTEDDEFSTYVSPFFTDQVQ